ncbi:hypothetical protein [Streptomyces sp. NPDC006270]|uniref:hypothetical protein n=1 Tax=Streptomyces sp. NPDC006270 TaxID=3364741 RepID=UPI0036C31FA7
MSNSSSVPLGLLLFGASGALIFVGCYALMRAVNAVRLAMSGVQAEGSCAGYSAGRFGQSVIVDYRALDGIEYTMTTEFWAGRLPAPGSRMDVIYLPRRPKISDVAPLNLWRVMSKSVTAVFLFPLTLALAISMAGSALEKMGVAL